MLRLHLVRQKRNAVSRLPDGIATLAKYLNAGTVSLLNVLPVSYTHLHYEEVPKSVSEEIVAKTKGTKAE